MDINNSYTTYGECRCCLAKGHHRYIKKEYYYNNIREVYKDIFLECFNLVLSTHKQISMLICSTCIQRLRDATSFRMMVVSTERQLLQAAARNNTKDTVFVNVSTEEESYSEDIKAELKTESTDIEPDVYAQDFVFDDCDTTKDNDIIVIDNTAEREEINLVDGEAELLARFSKPIRPLPTRCKLFRICPDYVYHLRRLQGRIINPKSLERFFDQPRKENIKYVTEKLAHVFNATALFEHTNATAFKTKTRNGYPCFYCRHIFDDHRTLREHQNIHPKSILFKLLTKYTEDKLVVYADVTDLKCNICGEDIPNLNKMKSHLTKIHDKRMYLQYPDRVIPFKLKDKDFECQVCGVNCETFGAVERHMNTHYGNYICEECGAGFVTKHRLGIHASKLHKQGNFPCEQCKKTFSTQVKYKIHVDVVHKLLKKYKCPKCAEKFKDYFTRQKHLVDSHGSERILYKCNVCERSFNRRYTLSCHVKRCHLEQRDVKCELCAYMCYTQTELREHMVKHGGFKQFECSVCKKTFARKKGLLGHMRIHSNDRRFSCSVCGLAFVQKCTLKGHMKTHQVVL